MTDRCRSCGVAIDWRRNDATGKPAPIDADPSPDGNVILLWDGSYHVLRRSDPTPAADVPRFFSHLKTCRDAKTWKEGRVKW